MTTTTNTIFQSDLQSERDFMLTALAVGAQIGYDLSGTTWAIVDKSTADKAIIYLPTPRIGSVNLADGDCAEWHKSNTGIEGDVYQKGDEFFDIASQYAGAWSLLYRPSEGWSVDTEGDTGAFVWSATPTEPANRMETYVREASLEATV